ncbi:GH25 family lysozyme [Blautia intestinalis]|uniref:GH25 family lysozyme n=1 Tax=Blautia intestinalis TaxID=2763028 RepID=UPI0022E3BDA6|nr:GH25 family lysozyme [Blautia intestinalis]
MSTKLIDISYWQGNLDFNKIKKAGINHIILRAGYRTTKDPKFDQYAKACQSVGIKIIGAYWFTYALNTAQAKNEAKLCMEICKPYNIPTIFYDFEYDTVKKAKEKGVTLGSKECNDFTIAFCDTIKAAGLTPGYYCNTDYYYNMYSDSVKKKGYIFWLAHYKSDYSYHESPISCDIFQYSSRARLAGFNQNFDGDICYNSKLLGNSTNSSTNSNNTNKTGDKMTTTTKNVRMSNCGHDENGRYHGGKEGDQTGTEWYLRSWYSYPWNYVIRWKDRTLANLYADLSIEAANNNLIGYDQYERNTFWAHLKASNYRPAQITIACETDCSAGTIALIKAVGYLKGIPELQKCNATYTGDMMNYFKSTNGQKYFTILTGKYLTNSSYAMRGDINLNTAHHVNITVDNGVNCGLTSTTTPTNTKNYLTVGDTGDAVKTLQTKLNKVGYKLNVDGIYGDNTLKAVKSFQTKYKKELEVDGVAGKNTISKLDSVIAAQNKKTSSTTSKAPSKVRKFVGKVNKNNAPVRKNPGKKYAQLTSYPTLNKGNLIDVCDTVKSASGNDWYYICIGGKIYGYIYSEHIDKA